MDRYIGLDVHKASTSVAVVGPSGKHVKSAVVETTGEALIEAIRLIPSPRHICFEEGTQSDGLYETLSPHAERVVVVGLALAGVRTGQRATREMLSLWRILSV